MSLRSLDFLFREAGINLRRDRLITFAAATTVGVALTILGASLLFFLNLRLWTERVASRIEVMAYFNSVPRERAENVTATVGGWPGVREAVFVPQEEAWEELRKTLARGGELTDTKNPLPDAVRVVATDPVLVPRLAARLEGLPEIETTKPTSAESRNPRSVLRSILALRNGAQIALLVVGILMSLAAVLIVHNTIRLTLLARWREIGIMQLVGATDLFVAAAFLLEGAFHGAVGAALSWAILLPAYSYLRHLAAQSHPLLLLVTPLAAWQLAFALLGWGVFVGVSGSLLAVRKFLHSRPHWET